MISASQLQSREQVYSHVDTKTGKRVDIAVDRIRYKLRGKKPITLEVDQELAVFFIENSGVEQHRIQALKRLSEAAFKLQVTQRPPLVCWFKDDEWLLADGNHTYVAAWLRGLTKIPAIEAGRQEWSPFLVKGYEKSLTDFSGIFPETSSGELTEKVLVDAVHSGTDQSG